MFVYVEPSAAMRRNNSNPNSMKEVAKRLLLLRIALGKTQEEMGKLAGVTANAWQNYEKARQPPGRKAAERIEQTTNAPREWVFSGVIVRLPLDLAHRLELAAHDLSKQTTTDRRKYRPQKAN